MSWRFRKTFKVLPGVKLNLTARGLSATLGASPFSLNVGPRGVYRNVSIPGTGIWDRQRIDGLHTDIDHQIKVLGIAAMLIHRREGKEIKLYSLCKN
jgi:hypothetical protein